MPTRRPGPSRVERTDPPRTSQRGSIGPHPPTDGVENRFPHFPQTRTKGGTEPIGRGCTDERRTPSASLHDRTPARKHPGPTGGRPNPIAGDPAPRRHADPAIRQRRTERSGPRPRRDERRSGGTRRRRNLRAGAGQRRARTKKCNRKRGTRIVPPPGNVVPQRRSLVAAATSLSPGAAASVRHSAPFGLSGGCRNPAVPRADSGEQSARRIPPRAVRWRRHFRRL